MSVRDQEQALTDAFDWVQAEHRVPLLDHFTKGTPRDAVVVLRMWARTAERAGMESIAFALTLEADIREQALAKEERQ